MNERKEDFSRDFTSDISGYELVRRILSHPRGDIGALIGLAQSEEADWLKADGRI